MTEPPEDAQRLSLVVQRILDAESLFEADGVRLRDDSEAVRQALEQGDREAVRRHLDQLAEHALALIDSEGISRSDALAVIHVVDGLRTTETPVDEVRPDPA